jgi:hypothetical protein
VSAPWRCLTREGKTLARCRSPWRPPGSLGCWRFNPRCSSQASQAQSISSIRTISWPGSLIRSSTPAAFCFTIQSYIRKAFRTTSA